MTRLNIPLFVALAASLLSAVDGRDVLPHQRMIRKRSPLGHVEERAPAFVVPRWPGLAERQILSLSESSTGSASASRTSSAAASATSNSAASATSEASTSQAATSSTASASVASSTVQTSSVVSTTRSGLLDSLTGLLGGSQTSTTVSSTSSTPSTSAVPTSTTAQATSTTPATTQQQQAAVTTAPAPTLNIATTTAPGPTTASPSIAVFTSIAPEAQQSQAAEQKARTAKITKNTIISLVVVASCIGGAVAIWTVIRKWKLSPSERFDDRMQPIDWAPNGGGAAGTHESIEEKHHRRAGSAGSHGSFTSGGVGQSEVGHGPAKSVYSDHAGHGAQAQDFPPPHDFTAGPGAAYGQYYSGQQQYAAGPGYADLQRGPSVSESNYSHGASVTRGMSYSRGATGYDAQPGAGGVPPLPNPYGGGYEYEDYGRPAAQGQGQQRAY